GCGGWSSGKLIRNDPPFGRDFSQANRPGSAGGALACGGCTFSGGEEGCFSSFWIDANAIVDPPALVAYHGPVRQVVVDCAVGQALLDACGGALGGLGRVRVQEELVATGAEAADAVLLPDLLAQRLEQGVAGAVAVGVVEPLQ